MEALVRLLSERDEAREHVARLCSALQSDEYPCPFEDCLGTITMGWDEECDDAGRVLSRWPTFAGSCAGEIEETQDSTAGSGQRPYYESFLVMRNHAECLNEWGCEGGYAQEVLTRANERARVLAALNGGTNE